MIQRFGLLAPLLLVLGCTGPAGAPIGTPTPGVVRASVTDTSVPFAASEAEALAPHGFMGYGAFGRLRIGCVVEILKTTDRGAQVKTVSCPDFVTDEMTPKAGLLGWVAKSAIETLPAIAPTPAAAPYQAKITHVAQLFTDGELYALSLFSGVVTREPGKPGYPSASAVLSPSTQILAGIDHQVLGLKFSPGSTAAPYMFEKVHVLDGPLANREGWLSLLNLQGDGLTFE